MGKKTTKILVMSDNHGNVKNMDTIIDKVKPDYKIHCGDYIISKKEMQSRFDYFVLGNNDIDEGDTTIDISIEGFRFHILHGHTLGMDIYHPKKLLKKLEDSRFDALIHGHLHIPIHVAKNNKTIFSPGSTDFPRDGNGATYGLILINGNKIKFKHKKIYDYV